MNLRGVTARVRSAGARCAAAMACVPAALGVPGFGRTAGRRRALEKHSSTEERFRSLANSAPVLIWVSGTDKRCTWFNRPWLEFTGRSLEQELGDGWAENVHPEDLGRCLATYTTAFDARRPFTMEYRLRRHDGSWRWMLDNGTPQHDPDGRFQGYIGSCIDITPQKEAESALREREQRYELVLAGSGAAIWDWDVPAKRVVYSRRWKQLRGLADGEVTDREEEWSGGIHPEDRGRVLEAIQAHFEGRTDVFCEEYRVRHKQGHWIWILDCGLARRDERGQVVRMAGSETNITERLRHEEVRRQSEAEARHLLQLNLAMMSSMGDGLYTLDRNGLVTYVNPEAERLLGWSAEELLGRPLHGMIQYMREDGSPCPIEECAGFQVLHHGAVLKDHEDVYIRKDRSFFPVSLSSSPFPDQDGEIAGLVVVFQDITARKQAERALRESLNEKEVLLREVHHRVKNNLQVISSLVSLQADAHSGQALHSHFHDVRDRVRTMALVHEKLYQSENLAQVDFAGYAQSLLSYLWHAHGAAREHIRLHLDLHPVTLPMDQAVPCGLLLNELATNALRHAFRTREQGEVTIELRRETDHPVILTVRDDGEGFPDAMTWRKPATMGLQLVHMLVDQLQGTMEVHSPPGARFSVRFQVSPSPRAVEGVVPQSRTPL